VIPDKAKPDSFIDLKTSSRICALTAYDYPTARILDESSIDIILVGDSLGMMVFGHTDTTKVTMGMMINHTIACSNGVKQSLLITDMPYRSYETSESALTNAKLLLEAGAHGVKLEGGSNVIPQIKTLIQNNIPVIGHLGFLPQSIKEEKYYKKKGKTESEKMEIKRDAKLLQDVGVSAIILESVESDLAKNVTKSLKIPTIGIGAGDFCNGEIRVINDIIGSYPWFIPPFAKSYCSIAQDIRDAVSAFRSSTLDETNL
jgi:3-methyl-2-oxobutanoate hydroxymethyltransferase